MVVSMSLNPAGLTQRLWWEGGTKTLSGAGGTFTHTLTKGASGQIVANLDWGIPAVEGNVTIVLYDGDPAGTGIAFTGTLQLRASSTLTLRKELTSGILGMVIAGRTDGDNTLFYNITYGY